MTAAWEEPWSRLLAFRQHLPENHEIPESLIRTYHELLAEIERATHFQLQNFRITEDTVRPKVVSFSYVRPRQVNYSKDNFCERTNLLMKLDGLIHFLEPRLPQLQPPQFHRNAGPLLPYEVLSLDLYRFIEFAGTGQWRGTSISNLYTVMKTDQPLLVDEMKRLHAELFLSIRKYVDDVKAFVPYIDEAGANEKFFYQGDFQLKVLPHGRPWFQSLEYRAAELAAKGAQLVKNAHRSKTVKGSVRSLVPLLPRTRHYPALVIY